MSLSANHFEVFGLPVAFEVDLDLLGHRYRELQRTVHPDNYAQASEKERRLAMQKTAQVNEAFQTLKHPFTRAQYLLLLHGIDVRQPDSNVTMDPDFLMAQMELREELATVKEHPQPMEILDAFLKRLEQQMQDLMRQISLQFTRNDLQAVHAHVNKYQFFKRLYDEAMALEEELI